MSLLSRYPVQKWLAVLAASVLLLACASDPARLNATTPPKSSIQFIDLASFDTSLAASLSAPLPEVDIAFYDRVTPSTLPERLQKWMASVEAGGGTVKVTPPPSTVVAKNPFMIISAISAVFTITKLAREASIRAEFNTAHAYDADIRLKVDDKGDNVVDKVVFTQKAKK